MGLSPSDSPAMSGPALVLDAKGVIELLFGGCIALRTWRTWDASGKCPRGFHIGGRKLWRMEDLKRWVAAGFPERREFEHGLRGGLRA